MEWCHFVHISDEFERNIFIQKVKRSNIDAMICKQEGITEITRDEIHRIQLEKLKYCTEERERTRGFLPRFAGKTGKPDRFEKPSFYDRNRSGTRWRQDAALLPGGSTESDIRTDKRNYRCR